MKSVKKWLWILVALAIAVIFLQNLAVEPFQILWTEVRLPRFLMFLLFLALGFVAGFIYARVRQKREGKQAGQPGQASPL